MRRGGMRRMQECAGPAGGDLLHALCVFVAFVEMQIAGEEYARLALEHLLLEKARARDLFVVLMARIRVLENPARLGHAEDEARRFVHARRDLLEVLDLRFVEVRT